MGTEKKKALYMEAAELLADRFDVEPDQVLEEYATAVETSRYPGPDCLGPHEVESHLNGDALSEASAVHVGECEMCSAVLEAARPTAAGLEEVLRTVRERFSSEERIVEKENIKVDAMS